LRILKTKISAFLSKIHLNEIVKSKKFKFIVLPVIIGSMLLFYGYYWYTYTLGANYTAELKYNYKEIAQEKLIEVGGTTTAAKVEKLSAEDSNTISANTTGEKVTGERAKGLVTIFNSTTDIKVLKAGTPLSCISNSCTGLGYTLDNDLNLGPGASDETAATAGDIGENYNLSAGAGRFKVATFDPQTEILASNVKPIAGGTPKKNIKVVSKADIVKAEESALSTLKDTLVTKIKNDPANEQYILASSATAIKVEKVSTNLDVKEGDEAELVNIGVKAKVTIDAIQKGEIDSLVTQIKKEVTPEGFVLDEVKTNITTGFTAKTKDTFEVSIKISSIAQPDLNVDKIKKELAGKQYSNAEKVLSSIPNLKGYNQNFEPKTLPQYFWKIPTNTHKINIKLVGEKS
jgi:hypothetical protein